MPFSKLKQYISGIKQAAQTPEDESVMDRTGEESALSEAFKDTAKTVGRVGLAALPDTSVTIPGYEVPTTYGTVKAPELTVDPMVMGSTKNVAKSAGALLEEAAQAKKFQGLRKVLPEAEMKKYAASQPEIGSSKALSAENIKDPSKEIQKILSGSEHQAKIQGLLAEKEAQRMANRQALEDLKGGAERKPTERLLKEYEELSQRKMNEGVTDLKGDPEINKKFNELQRMMKQEQTTEAFKASKLR